MFRRRRANFVEPLEPRTLLAATYYVSPTGNNASAGTSPTTAWKTIDRVNGKDFAPGDRVLFQGGKTFTVSSAKGANLLTTSAFSSGYTGWNDTLGTSSARSAVVSNVGHSGGGLRISGS